jgi:curved DNA-binding protein CbpA
VKPQTDHYSVLGVPPSATIGELRRAYRRLAKVHHPDKNPGDEQNARLQFERVRLAYEVLSDERKRQLYDRHTRPRAADHTPQTDDPTDIAYRMLERLLAEAAEEGLAWFDRLLRVTRATARTLDLPRYLEYGDARDCEFLLAEALQRGGRDEEAIGLYERAIARESRRPYFRAFTQEIRDRLQRLYFGRVRRAAHAEQLPPRFDHPLSEVFRMGATRRERAYWYKRLAEALAEGDHMDEARHALATALDLAPNLSGVKRLSRLLGVVPVSPHPVAVAFVARTAT